MARSVLHNKHPLSGTSLIHAIHAAGVDADAWPSVLECLRTGLDARVVTLGHHEFKTGIDTVWLESPDDARFSEEMATFAARNPWFMSSEDYRCGRVMTGDELISHNDLRRTDFYHDFLRPRGLLHRLCGVVAQRADGVFCLSAYRDENQGGFAVREKTELESLLGHIKQSIESHWRWQESDDLARALLTLFDHDTNAMILATGDTETIYRNPAAEKLLDGRLGLCMDGTRLVAASSADQRTLREVIARVAQQHPAQLAASPHVVTLACTPPMPPIVVVVRAAGQVFMRQAGARRGLALVTVRNGHAMHDPASCAFARQYELTAAQAKVSALVFAGQSLPMIAHALNVSENTVRSHLKVVFQKTNTHGQMDLVHLHARVCQSLQ